MICSTTEAASWGALLITLTTPAPMPASFSTSPTKRWVAGQISELFKITVLPQAIGMARARVAKIIGAFQGAILNTTPQGTRIAIDIRSEEHTSELQSRGHIVCRL